MSFEEDHGFESRDEYDSIKNMVVEIEVNDYVVYECKADVKLYRGVPCEAVVNEMTRQVFDYDGDGELFDELQLCPSEFPPYIQSAAEKKLVENYWGY